jgi:hypothetical protein
MMIIMDDDGDYFDDYDDYYDYEDDEDYDYDGYLLLC